MSIYGEPQILIDDDQTDRIGVRTLVLSQLWQASRSDLSIEEIDAEEPGIPPTPGGVLLIGKQRRRQGGTYRTSWTFEGVNGDGKTVTFKDRTNSLDYAFEPGLSQVPIALWMGKNGDDSSAFQNLMQQYQGQFDPTSGNVIWPQTLQANAQATTNGMPGQSSSDSGGSNPMFGIQDFFRMEGTYRFRYAMISVPSNIYQGAGLVSASLPGIPPQVSGGRNWLKVPPQWKRRGLIFDISEEYWLSGIGGWPQPIYGGNNSASGNTDLSITGLTTGFLSNSQET